MVLRRTYAVLVTTYYAVHYTIPLVVGFRRSELGLIFFFWDIGPFCSWWRPGKFPVRSTAARKPLHRGPAGARMAGCNYSYIK